MKGVPAVFRLLFSWHVSMRLFLALGAILLTLTVISGLASAEWDMAWPALLLFMPPVMLAPVAFRQLVGNRQLALVPHLRSAAVAALLLVPLIAALIVFVLVRLAWPLADLPGPASIALGVFGLLSAYLLLWQWLCTFTAGTFVHLAIVFVVLRVAFDDPQLLLTAADVPWLVTSAAACGWAWLWSALRGSARLAPPAKGLDAWSSPSFRFDRTTGRRPSAAGRAEPAGTLMRGASAGRIQHAVNALAYLIGASGVAFLCLVLVFPDNGRLGETDPALLFLWISLLSAANFAPLAISEWPLRLRYLWLRSPGDREALWSKLEHALRGEILIVTVLALLVALGMLAFTAIAPAYLLAYVGGCCLGTLWSCYFGFWMRLTGSSLMVFSSVLIFCWALVFGTVLSVFLAFPPDALLWLLPVFAALALHSRFRAREAFLRHDWCAVGPARRRREPMARGGRAPGAAAGGVD